MPIIVEVSMSSANLTTEFEERDGVHVVRLSGPLDSMTHDQVKNLLDPLVNKPHVHMVLDCQSVTYVNSRSITLLAHYQRAISSNLGFFGVAGLTPRILKGIQLLGMGKLLRLYPAVGDALKVATSLAGPASSAGAARAENEAVQPLAV
jgi:anti-sigma B factor antagonist